MPPPREEDSDHELSQMAAQLGQHRGRRLLFLLLAGATGWGGRELWLRNPEWRSTRQAPPVAEQTVAARSTAPAKAVVPRPARRRTAKAARVAVRQAATPSMAVAIAPPSAPPPLASVPAPAEPPPAEPPPEESAPEESAPEESAPEESAPEPEEQLVGEGNGEAIARGIAADKRAAIQACYERELKRTPELRGRVTVELDLAPPQRVEEVRVLDDLARPAFTQCVSDAMQHVRFLALNEEASIQLPFILTARAH